MTHTHPAETVTPAADEIAATEIIIDILGTPDSQGRRTFAAYWRDNTAPAGVRGQIFNANPDDFAARNLHAGATTRIRNSQAMHAA